jgi:hypothetical protein
VRKVNIGTQEKSKFANIGDYWNDETMEKIADLLREYQDPFTTTFSKIKGIARIGKDEYPIETKFQASKTETLQIESKVQGKSESRA